MNKNEKMALAFAREAHKGQKRKWSNKEYVTHPIAVHDILKRVTTDDSVLCAALLHDVIEDTRFTYDDIRKKFGKRIADIVSEVTKDKQGKFNIKTKEGLMVKLADTLHNISDNRRKKYLKKKIDFLYHFITEVKAMKKNKDAEKGEGDSMDLGGLTDVSSFAPKGKQKK